MIGITQSVSFAPPVNMTSVTFIATSIEIIEISDIPIAVLKASLSAICRIKIIVSRIIEVINPFMMAKAIIATTGQGIPVN